jgi:hypothetical protein
MKIKEIKENYYFENLTENHDVTHFDCGDDDLNDFLKNDALKQQNANLNVTKLVIYKGDIIGYFSLLTDTLILKNIRDTDLKRDIKDMLEIKSKNRKLPAIKIGRFAIDEKYSGYGIGSDILLNIVNNIREISKNQIGLRFIIVEGYAKEYTFYTEHSNFINLEKDDKIIKEKLDIIIKKNPKQTFYLYLDLKILERDFTNIV